MRRISLLSAGVLIAPLLIACSSSDGGTIEPGTFSCGDAGLRCETATQICAIVLTDNGAVGTTPTLEVRCSDYGSCRSCDCMGGDDAGAGHLACNTYSCSVTNGGMTLRYHMCA